MKKQIQKLEDQISELREMTTALSVIVSLLAGKERINQINEFAKKIQTLSTENQKYFTEAMEYFAAEAKKEGWEIR